MIVHVRYAIMVTAINMAGGVSPAADIVPLASYRAVQTDIAGLAPNRLSVMTYNIKGLPWPIASDRAQAIDEIGARLRRAREQGNQPDVIMLQEAFGDTAQRIADRAGYRFVAIGPDAAEQARYRFSTPIPRDWSRGENIGKSLNSGLAILSDFPLSDVETLAFGDQACAGFDCLANKGIVKASVDVPGYAAPVRLFNTHLNSRKASGVEIGKANRAFRRQLMIAARFVDDATDPASPMIFAGDFNIGKDKDRRATCLAWPVTRRVNRTVARPIRRSGARAATRPQPPGLAEDRAGVRASPQHGSHPARFAVSRLSGDPR